MNNNNSNPPCNRQQERQVPDDALTLRRTMGAMEGSSRPAESMQTLALPASLQQLWSSVPGSSQQPGRSSAAERMPWLSSGSPSILSSPTFPHRGLPQPEGQNTTTTTRELILLARAQIQREEQELAAMRALLMQRELAARQNDLERTASLLLQNNNQVADRDPTLPLSIHGSGTPGVSSESNSTGREASLLGSATANSRSTFSSMLGNMLSTTTALAPSTQAPSFCLSSSPLNGAPLVEGMPNYSIDTMCVNSAPIIPHQEMRPQRETTFAPKRSSSASGASSHHAAGIGSATEDLGSDDVNYESDDEYFRSRPLDSAAVAAASAAKDGNDDQTDQDFKRSKESFALKLYRILYEAEKNGQSDIISFLPHGRAFIVRDQKRFTAEIMPKYFVGERINTFLKQLSLYSFQRISQGPDKGGYFHQYFVKGKRHLCNRIRRKKTRIPKAVLEQQRREKEEQERKREQQKKGEGQDLLDNDNRKGKGEKKV